MSWRLNNLVRKAHWRGQLAGLTGRNGAPVTDRPCDLCGAPLSRENDSGTCKECQLVLANEEPSDER